MSTSVLEELTGLRREDAERQMRDPAQRQAWENRALATPLPPSFAFALAQPGLSVIAEIKRASPSRGRIADIAEAVPLARAYREGGASAVSVLTEPHRFLGRDVDLEEVAADTGLPCLRKDFTTLPFQIVQARALGASAVLLIAALFERPAAMETLLRVADRVGLDVLVEVHDEAEVERALEAGARIIGVNHRNLHDFSMDMDRFARLRPRLPGHVIAVAESGIRTADDARRMADAGADAILVGESLAGSPDPAAALRALLAGSHP